MVRRVILLGTGPRGGEGMTFAELTLDELKDPVPLLMNSFFTPSESSKAAGQEYPQRLKLRSSDRDAPVSMTAGAQLDAIREWNNLQGRRKRDSVVRSTLILRKLLNLRFAQLAQFAKKHDFGNFVRT